MRKMPAYLVLIFLLMACTSDQNPTEAALQDYLETYLHDADMEQVWLVPKTACSGCLKACFAELEKEADKWQSKTVIITSDSLKLTTSIRRHWPWHFDQSGAVDLLPGPVVDLQVLTWKDEQPVLMKRIKD